MEDSHKERAEAEGFSAQLRAKLLHWTGPRRNLGCCKSVGLLLSGLGCFKIWEFPKMGVPYLGVLIIRILLFGVLYWGPLFLETPICCNIGPRLAIRGMHAGDKGLEKKQNDKRGHRQRPRSTCCGRKMICLTLSWVCGAYSIHPPCFVPNPEFHTTPMTTGLAFGLSNVVKQRVRPTQTKIKQGKPWLHFLSISRTTFDNLWWSEHDEMCSEVEATFVPLGTSLYF